MASLEKKNSNRSKKKETKRETKSPLREYAKYSTIGFQMMIIILLAVIGGMKLDDWVRGIDFPLFTLVGAILGVVLGVYYAIKDFIK